MLSFLRTHWRHVSSGLLALAVVGAAAPRVYAALAGDDCCKPGSSCCFPGSPCCHHATPPAPTPGK